MSKIRNSGLDQYGAERFEQQQSGTAGIEGVQQFLNPVTSTSTEHAIHYKTVFANAKEAGAEIKSVGGQD